VDNGTSQTATLVSGDGLFVNNSLHREFSSVRFYQASERYTDRDGLHRTVKVGLYIGKTENTLSKINIATLHTRGREIKER
jgi:hypothetical protein